MPPLRLAAFAGAVLLGAVLRLHGIRDQLLLSDEWHAPHAAALASAWQLLGLVTLGATSIPLNVYTRLVLDGPGWSELALRLPALVPGLAALIVFPVGILIAAEGVESHRVERCDQRATTATEVEHARAGFFTAEILQGAAQVFGDFLHGDPNLPRGIWDGHNWRNLGGRRGSGVPLHWKRGLPSPHRHCPWVRAQVVYLALATAIYRRT